jgi:hypothetical protein
MAGKLLLLVLLAMRCLVASGNGSCAGVCIAKVGEACNFTLSFNSGNQYMDAGGSCTSCPGNCSDSMGNSYCSSKNYKKYWCHYLLCLSFQVLMVPVLEGVVFTLRIEALFLFSQALGWM